MLAGIYRRFKSIRTTVFFIFVLLSITIFILQANAGSSSYRYYVLNPNTSTGDLEVISLSDSNQITAGATVLSLTKYQRGTIPATSITLGMEITGTAPFSLGSTVNGIDLPVPARFAGVDFVIPHRRNSTHTYYMMSPYGDAQVQVTLAGALQSVTLFKNEVFAFDAGIDNTIAGIVRSDMPIVVVHDNASSDVYPVLPAAKELWGVNSTATTIGALEDNTTITVYASDGTSDVYTPPAGVRVNVSVGSAAFNGQASGLYIVADKPIAAIQSADADGSESSGFWSREHLGTRYGLPVGSQYVAVVCPEANTTVTLYDGVNTPVVSACGGDGINIPGKAYFGSAVSGVNIAAGAYIESDRPVYLMYEESTRNDERNLLGHTEKYYTLNPAHATGVMDVISLADNNQITAGSTTLLLGQDQQGTIPAADLNPGTEIWGTAPFGLGSSIDGTDLPVSETLVGVAFVVPHYRGSHTYYLMSPYGDTQAHINLAGVIQTVALPKGQVYTFNAGADNTISGIIQSDMPIVASHAAGTSDAYPIPPVATEVWGINSVISLIGALENNTTATVYADDGSTKTYPLGAGGSVLIDIGSTAAEGAGSSIHIVADKPIAAIQTSDSDGSETTGYWPREYLATRYGLPETSQYIAIACPDANTTVSLKDGLNPPVNQACGGDGTTPGKAYFGSTIDGANLPAGAIIESDLPVYLIYEQSDTNDERNLLGSNITVTAQALPSPVINFGPSVANDSTHTITGTATPGQEVRLYSGGILVTSTVADASGNYSFTVTLSSGQNSYTVTVFDGSTESVPSAPHNVYYDTDPNLYHYILNSNTANNAIDIISLVDGNQVQVGTSTTTLNQYQPLNVVASEINQGSRITSTGPVSVGGSANVTDMPVPSRFAGNAFVIPHYRDTHSYLLMSPYGNATVQVNVGGTLQTETLSKDQVFEFSAGVNNTISGTLRSDLPIVVAHVGATSDPYPVPPAATELWGVNSAYTYIGALEDGTNVTVYADDGSSTSYPLNEGGLQNVAIGSGAAQGAGSGFYIVADKPIAAIQAADSDGSDATSFWSREYLSTRVAIPTGAQYVAVVCPDANTIVTLNDGVNPPDSQACNGDGTIPGKAYFGSINAGINVTAGTTIEANKPVYIYYEEAGFNDEHNVLGTLASMNTPPVITSPGTLTGTEGDSVNQGITITDAQQDTLTYTITGLPAGLILDTSTKTITGTIQTGAAAASPYTVNLTVDDGFTTSSINFSWVVNASGGSSPPAANAGNDQTVGEGISVALDASASTGQITSYLWEQVGGPVVTLSSTSTVTTSFTTPDGINTTYFTFKLTVTDNTGLTSTDEVVIQVDDTGGITGTVIPSGPISNASLTGNNILASGNTYTVNSHLTIPSGYILAIEQGATLKFVAAGITVRGMLQAQGTAANPVVFTSGLVAPAVNDWWGLIFSGTGSVLDNVIIQYATTGADFYGDGVIQNSTLRFNQDGIKLNVAGGSILNNTIEDNSQYGIYVDGDFNTLIAPTIVGNTLQRNDIGIYMYFSSAPVITSNIITANRLGVLTRGYSSVLYSPTPVIIGNQIYSNTEYNYQTVYNTNPASTYLDATGNWWGTTDPAAIAASIYDYADNSASSAIIDFSGYLDGPNGSAVVGNNLSIITTDTTFRAGQTYDVTATLQVMPGATLTIESGTTVQFPANSRLHVSAGATLIIQPGATLQFPANYQLNVWGTLLAQGTATSPITFTSSATTKAVNDWQGITIYSNGNVIDNVIIEYATTGVWFKADGVIQNSTLHFNQDGIHFQTPGASVTTDGSARNNNIEDNSKNGIIVTSGSGAAAASLTFIGNTLQRNDIGISMRYTVAPVVTGNIITDNRLGVWVSGSSGVLAYNPAPVVTGNLLYSNTAYNYQTVNMTNPASTILDATGNWWGTTDPAEITASIYDYPDSVYGAIVDFSGFMNAPWPIITLDSPTDGMRTNRFVNFTGSLNTPATLTIAGQVVPLAADNSFNFGPVTLTEGSNDIQVVATDSLAQTDQLTVTLILDSTPPAPPVTGLVNFDESVAGVVTVSGLAGSVEAGVTVNLVNDRSGETITLTAAADGSFSGTIATQGGDGLSVIVADDLGNATLPLNHDVSGTPPALTLTITKPVNGAQIADDKVTVTGTLQGPANSGVAVNGVVATIYKGQFVASNVPLVTGANTLTVSATSEDGQSDSQSLNVTSTGPSVLDVSVSPLSGFEPLTVTFTVNSVTPGDIQSVAIDVDGDGTDDIPSNAITYSYTPLSIDKPSTITKAVASYTYNTAGVYNAVITVTDPNTVSRQSTQSITVESQDALDAALQRIWGKIKTNLIAGNNEGALAYFSGGSQARYRTVLQDISSELPTMFTNFPPIYQTKASPGMAEYFVVVPEGGVNYGYHLYFMKGPDGIWKLQGM